MTARRERAASTLIAATLSMICIASCHTGQAREFPGSTSMAPAASSPLPRTSPSISTTKSNSVSAAPATASESADLEPSVWIDPAKIPLDAGYHWPALANRSKKLDNARFVFEEQCGSTRSSEHGDPTAMSISKAARAGSGNTGDWEAEERITHWPGDSLRTSQTAEMLFKSLVAELKNCAQTSPGATVSLGGNQPTGVTATITTTQGGNTTTTHEYLAFSACGGAVAELSLSAIAPPKTPWEAMSDSDVLDAMTTPICNANQGN